ncbi:MAG: HAD family hydrolase [Gemmatimonadaceae bacterium]
MPLTHVFFDIGGVLGTNGWDREQRARAIEHFGLDEEFNGRHAELIGEWESGRITLADYLDSTVFFEPQPFAREDFRAFMLGQSEGWPASIALARQVAERGRVRLFTLNNEAEELNAHRIATFGLRGIFDAFLSSCWLGIRKPSPVIFTRALGIAQAAPAGVLFVDDREQNLGPARRMGFETHLFRGAEGLEAALRAHELL